jgi:hypothetical protein
MSSSEATVGGVGGCRCGEGEVGWGWGGALEARRGRTGGEGGDPISKGPVAACGASGGGRGGMGGWGCRKGIPHGDPRRRLQQL